MSLFSPAPDIRNVPDIRAMGDIRHTLFYPATLLSQYVTAPRLTALIQSMEYAIDPEADIDEFFRLVLDPNSAEGWGLDCWGRIVAMPRKLRLPGASDSFGFNGSDLHTFNQGAFYAAMITDTHTLADRAYRLLIYFKAAVNLTNGSLADINRLLAWLFEGRGTIAALHVGTMHMRYLVRFVMEPYERALMTTEAVPPKPAGVLVDWYYVPEPTFGFAGSGLHPFNQGAFTPGGPTDGDTD